MYKRQEQISAVYEVLEELGIEEKDTLLVLNKIDQIKSSTALEGLLNRYPHAVAVSAKTAEGFESLHRVVSDALSRSFRNVDVVLPVQDGKLLAFLAAHGEVISTHYDEETVSVHCRIPQKYLGRVEDQVISIQERAASDDGAPAAETDPSLPATDEDDVCSVDDVA